MGKKSNATRFPVARIKKLIQADEDVGKVAGGTPVVVSKAIELFLASLVAECVKDADGRGSKKITAYGLKRAVTTNPMFDFCAEIVAEIPDPLTKDEDEPAEKKKRAPRKPAASKAKKAKVEAAMDEDEEEEEKVKRKVNKREEENYEEEEDDKDEDYE